MVLNRDIEWNQAESRINIQVENDVLLDRFQNLKMELCDFLRIQLNNYNLYIEAKLKENDDHKIIYSSQDKHNFMIQKFPIIAKFKSRLGLEINF